MLLLVSPIAPIPQCYFSGSRDMTVAAATAKLYYTERKKSYLEKHIINKKNKCATYDLHIG